MPKGPASTAKITNASMRVAILSIIYGILSVLMIFVNKLIVSGDNSVSPEALLIVQCIVSAMFIFLGSIIPRHTLRISWNDFCLCLVVNVAFVTTMLANSATLKHLSIHMVTLLKCCAVVVTALGERIVFEKEISRSTWVALIMIVIGSAIGYVSDLEFSLVGYLWMALAIVGSACYVILSKMLVSKASIPFFTAVFWNCFTSAIMLILYSIIRGSIGGVIAVFTRETDSVAHSPWFVIFSGVLGLALNISTFSLLGHASATSYVVVGAGKKIIQVIVSYLFFSREIVPANVAGVCIGLAGATYYGYIKWRAQNGREAVRDDSIELLTDAEGSST